ncbi:hypothetical protein PV08_07644 [Exophiala spinifera]|uniref:peptidylprolyl isomerase n=1 Tax=Exophiala spinifera TaxID=91928 RepID=A0A0D2BUA5_9EURO|nr:uncharacterized protein PV08_07644 [Exophiala spinifera]KIW14859.1 hypothetical protein PV08_07644 [Exophiala spinifera]
MATSTIQPQPLTAPLNEDAIASLQALAKDRTLTTKLAKYLKDASDHLAQTVDQLNEIGYDRRIRHDRHRKRRNGNDGGHDDADREFEEFQSKVDTLTNKMDMSIRAIVDNQIWLEDLPNAIKEAAGRAELSSTQTQQSYNPTPLSTRRTVPDDDDEEEDDDDDEDHPPRTRNRNSTAQSAPHAADVPHVLLSAALQKQQREWSSKTPTEKYAHHNFYAGFKRMLYDALHPGEEQPPMPDPGLWFAAEEGRDILLSQRVRRGGDDSEESDVEIARETTRIKCPITLLPFQDPVTSEKCKHSYEKEAIFGMLRTSREYALLGADQLRELSQIPNRVERSRREREMQIRTVKCPECNVPLTEDDLQPNLALKRRVQRHLALLAKKNRDETATSDVDDDDEDGDGPGVRGARQGTLRRPVGLGSSPVVASTAKSKKQFKAERLSGVGGRRDPGSANLHGEDDEDDDDDDDEGEGSGSSRLLPGTPSRNQLPDSTMTTTILELGDDD